MGDDIRDTFKRSLNRLIEKTSVSQADLARILDVSPTTVNNWVKGYNVPRMDKIDMLCKYFNVSRDYFIGSPDESRFYYLDEATRAIADDIKNNDELSLLFDAARDASPEDLETVHQMLLALKRKERHDD